MRAKIPWLLLLSVIFLPGLMPKSIQSSTDERAIIYAYMDCPRCVEYITELTYALENIGVTDVEIKDLGSHMHKSQAMEELNDLNDRFNIPVSMHGTIVVVIDNRYVFEGYIPVNVIVDCITGDNEYQSLVVYKSEYSNQYLVMDENGEIWECTIEYSVQECLPEKKHHLSSWPFLSLIIVSGFLDGINPCAFAVLLFFLAFLFTVAKTTPLSVLKKRIFKVGSIYIISIYIGYLLIGVGLLKVISFTPFPHLIAHIGAILVIGLGIINIKDYFFYGKGVSLKIPTVRWRTIARWIHKATLPSTVIVGLLVALFEFPCTGGIYVSIIGMLAVKTTQVQAFLYLLLYNIAFILPLIGILAFASNKQVVEKMREWQHEKVRHLRLLMGLFMIALGIIIFFI